MAGTVGVRLRRETVRSGLDGTAAEVDDGRPSLRVGWILTSLWEGDT